jgi:hypothetical protein
MSIIDPKVRKVVALATLGCVLAGSAAWGEEPKPPRLKTLVAAMAKEAKDWRKQNRAYPIEVKTLPNEFIAIPDIRKKLTKLLGSRLDSDGTLDGYLKWQILNMGPDLNKVKTSDILKILKTLPATSPLPQLGEGHRKLLASAGKLSAAEFAKRIQPVLDGYYKQIDLYKGINKPALEYRSKIVVRIPIEGGLRLYGNTLNAYEQYRSLNFETGSTGKKRKKDVTVNPVSGKVVSAAKMLGVVKKPIPGSIRSGVSGLLSRIKKMDEAHRAKKRVVGYTVKGTKVTPKAIPAPFAKTTYADLMKFLKTGQYPISKK